MITSSNSGESRVVVLGGGNGTSRLLTALLPLFQQKKIASLHALVHMADDGGSTGKLREQYAVGAMGDLTKCLMALSSLRGDVRGEAFLKALEYRFSNGDFEGHTLRNAFLTALELTSDLDSAIATMARILQLPKYTGVVPTTLTPLTQQVEIKKGDEWIVVGEGEHFIAHNVDLQNNGSLRAEDVRVTFKEKDVKVNERASKILSEATHIIIAPGHTYGTILPTLASIASDKALKESKGKLITVMTLLTTPKQTEGWSGEDFVHVYESYLGRSIDTVIANTTQIDMELVPGQDWVSFENSKDNTSIMTSDIARAETKPKQAGDVVPRAIAVHDLETLTTLFESLLK